MSYGGKYGVGVDKRGNKYYAQAHKNGKHIYLGSYNTPEDAQKAHWDYKLKEFGIKKYEPIFENNLVKIPVSKNGIKYNGVYALVDRDDYDKVCKYNWSLSSGYVVVKTDGKVKAMHQIILGMCSDHKNGDRLDNRKCNLRLATQQQNMANTKKIIRNNDYHINSSKYKGVMKRSDYVSKWRARIRFNGKLIHLGNFDNEIKAAIAYDKKAIELFGEFACVNFPTDNQREAI